MAQKQMRIGGQKGAGTMSIMGPQCKQTSGKPYVFYHQMGPYDAKPTGLRMSSCFVAMDNCRNDMFTICDMSVDAMGHVENPMVECAMELTPDILMLGAKEADSGPGRGMLLKHSASKTMTQQWLRMEALYGWGVFPMRAEEQKVFLVGKDRNSAQRIPLATARFIEAFLDTDKEDDPAGGLLQGDNWKADMNKFWGSTMENHSEDRLQERQLNKFYPTAGEPFTPTDFKKVTLMLSYGYVDIWGILYHGKSPEILWDVNTLAGGVFAELIQSEPDPQALAINLPKKMAVGVNYDCLCFLDKESRKGVYILIESGSQEFSDVALCLTAIYKWSGIPSDGKTLHKEDFDVLTGPSRAKLLGWALKGESVEATKFIDLAKCFKEE